MVNRILLADDELALRFLLTETLSDEGYEITEAADGNEAVQCLLANTYDLLILDYMMPEKTGVEVCEFLRQTENDNQHIPVILLTAKTQEKDRELAKVAGASTYIVKPFSPMHLLDTVEKLLTASYPCKAGESID